jgi:hypothetical protein
VLIPGIELDYPTRRHMKLGLRFYRFVTTVDSLFCNYVVHCLII